MDAVRTVEVTYTYPFAAERVWALATDYGALGKVMKGIASIQGLPDGRAQAGQKLEVMVSLFGKLPAQPYFIEVLSCDDDKMIMQSNEHGAGVKTWQHTLTVAPTKTGCQLKDHIQIDAGWLTSVLALWAQYLYGARHKPRLEMLESGEF